MRTVAHLYHHGRTRTQTDAQHALRAALDDCVEFFTEHGVGGAGCLNQLGVVHHGGCDRGGARIRAEVADCRTEGRVGACGTGQGDGVHGCAAAVNADGGYRLAGERLNFFGDDLLQRVRGVEVVVQGPVLRALFKVAALKLGGACPQECGVLAGAGMRQGSTRQVGLNHGLVRL